MMLAHEQSKGAQAGRVTWREFGADKVGPEMFRVKPLSFIPSCFCGSEFHVFQAHSTGHRSSGKSLIAVWLSGYVA